MSFSKHKIIILGVVLNATNEENIWILKFALFFTIGVKPGLFWTKWAVKSFNPGIAECTLCVSLSFSLACTAAPR